jgi:DNA repair protein RadA/Sms
MALASAARREPLTGAAGLPLACFGELGLTGELRHVAHPERRLAEARKFGLEPVIAPAAAERLDGLSGQASLRAALRTAFASRRAGSDEDLRAAA